MQGLYGVGRAVHKSIRRTLNNSLANGLSLSMRFKLAGKYEPVNFGVSYVPIVYQGH